MVPLFFLIFIDDILVYRNLQAFFYCYAGDTKLLATGSDLNQNLQDNLDVLKLWASDNQLSFNTGKSCFLHLNAIKDLKLFVRNSEIE